MIKVYIYFYVAEGTLKVFDIISVPGSSYGVGIGHGLLMEKYDKLAGSTCWMDQKKALTT